MTNITIIACLAAVTITKCKGLTCICHITLHEANSEKFLPFCYIFFLMKFKDLPVHFLTISKLTVQALLRSRKDADADELLLSVELKWPKLSFRPLR